MSERLTPTLLVGLAGLLVSVAVAWIVQTREVRVAEAEFRLLAEERILAIEHEFTGVDVVVEALAALFDTSDQIERDRFRAFTAPLLAHHRGLLALGFDRRVTAAERARHEQTYRSEHAPDYQITERSADGQLVRAADRSEHVVVQYIEPLAGNERALGFDIAAEPVRREALARARDTGRPAATARISLVQANEPNSGVLVSHPVYRTGPNVETLEERRRHLVGYAVGVYRVDEAIRAVLGPLGSEQLEIQLTDTAGLPGQRRLYPLSGEDTTPIAPDAVSAGVFGSPMPTLSANFEVGGRTWVAAARPRPAAWAAGPLTAGALGVLLSGLLLTVLLVGYLARQQTLNARLRGQIVERERGEARQALLASELDHRVKNTLATVLALADETVAHSSDFLDFHAAFRGRLHSMARAHEALARGSWEGAGLAELARLILQPTAGGREAPVFIEGDDVLLPARAVQPLAIVLNELMTNALKHGALSVAEGHARLRCESDDAHGVDLEWEETGGPPVAPPARSGLGLALVKDLIEQELAGNIDVAFPKGGFRCRIHIALRSDDETRPSSTARQMPAEVEPNANGSMRILVVEDDHLQSRRMTRLLEQIGCEVLGPVGRLEPALQAAREASLDGALLDLNLRGESGVPIAEVLAERGCPFAFVTGFAQLEGREDLPKPLDQAPLLTKPLKADELKEIIRSFQATRTAA